MAKTIGPIIVILVIGFLPSSSAQHYPLILDFENATDSFQFMDCSNYSWQPDTSEGYPSPPSLKSARMGSSGVSSICMNITGPMEVGFWWKVDETPAKVGKLSFYIDGAPEPASVCDSSEWKFKLYNIRSSGEHQIKWEFNKTRSYMLDRGSGWIDLVIIAQNVTSIYNPTENTSCDTGFIIMPNETQSLNAITYERTAGNVYYINNTTEYNSYIYNNYYNNTTNVLYNVSNEQRENLSYSVPSNISLDQLTITVNKLDIETEQIKILNKSCFINILSPRDNQTFSYNIYYNTGQEDPLILPIEFNVSEEIYQYKVFVTPINESESIFVTEGLINISGVLNTRVDLSRYKKRLSQGFEVRIDFIEMKGKSDCKIVKGLKITPILVGDLDTWNETIDDNSKDLKILSSSEQYLELLVEQCRTNNFQKVILDNANKNYLLEAPMNLDFDLDIQGESPEGVVISLINDSEYEYIIKLESNHNLSNITIDAGDGICDKKGIVMHDIKNKNINLSCIHLKNFGCYRNNHCESCDLSNKGFGLSLINSSGVYLNTCKFEGYKGIHLINSKIAASLCDFSEIMPRIDDTNHYFCIAQYNSTYIDSNCSYPTSEPNVDSLCIYNCHDKITNGNCE